MADYDYRTISSRTTAAEAGQYDAGLRAYMLRVYNYMAIGLALTGLTAYALFNASVVTDPSGAILGLTSLGQTLFGTPFKWVVALAPLGVFFLLYARINKMSVGAAQATFWIYAALTGASLATLLMVYTQTSVAKVFFITAATFGTLSLYGYTTKKDLTGFGSFLFMGLIGIVLASVVNMFLHSGMMGWIISVVGVGIFAGLTAYDTQDIKNTYYNASGDEASVGRLAIMGALRLYLDFINMFIMLMQLLGDRR
ncbi:MAG: Bax inhibitor-1/YccA family protein [Rhizomicrobium sp.]